MEREIGKARVIRPGRSAPLHSVYRHRAIDSVKPRMMHDIRPAPQAAALPRPGNVAPQPAAISSAVVASSEEIMRPSAPLPGANRLPVDAAQSTSLHNSATFPFDAPVPSPWHVQNPQAANSPAELPLQAKATPPKNRHVRIPLPLLRRLALPRVALRMPHLIATGAVFLFGLGIFVAWNGFKTNHTVVAQVRHISQQVAHGDPANNTAQPDVAPPAETKPTAGIGSYHVAPDLPRELKIPSLGVDARVLRLGVLADNELATPATIFDTGWYDGSSKPGEQGAVLIDGHVSGPTQHGVFYGLKTLKSGDKITLGRGDGQEFTYTVVNTKTYDANNVDMVAALSPVTPGKPGLNLITCTGKLDSTQTHFQQRIVVFATLQ